MELRQLRYFVRVVELGSFGRAALDLGVVTSALSQQIALLESELSTRLLVRSSTGTTPTDAGIAFLRQARLALRHVDGAAEAARQARLTGLVSVGLAPSTAAVLGLPFMRAMRERYPDVQLHLVDSLSGHLATQLNERRLDLAVLFETEASRRLSVIPLLDEGLYVVGAPDLAGMPRGKTVHIRQLGDLPLILPSPQHGLRSIVATAFAHAKCAPRIVAEIDGLALLMDAVRGGVGATIQPWSATARFPGLTAVAVKDAGAQRRNILASLSDDELSPAALAARVVLAETVRNLVAAGKWTGARLHEN